MNAVDLNVAATPRFPSTFAGALAGADYRTNLVLFDASGRGGVATLWASSGRITSLFIPPNAQQQYNGIGSSLTLSAETVGALQLTPSSGAMIATAIAVDNRTNDPTAFPPDLSGGKLRTIPAIGHVDGANGSVFRSDVALYNPTAEKRTVFLEATSWDTAFRWQTQIMLNPGEARVLRDALRETFQLDGIARLRYWAPPPADNPVRVTSRTYSVDPVTGGTYGFLMPPLNSFQTAGPGDTLEILGATGDPQFRTNLGLVELTALPTSARVRVRIEILDDHSKSVDAFETTLPTAGGTQLGDILRGRVLGAAVIRVTSIDAQIGAWATLVDNGTNDSTLLTSALAAK